MLLPIFWIKAVELHTAWALPVEMCAQGWRRLENAQLSSHICYSERAAVIYFFSPNTWFQQAGTWRRNICTMKSVQDDQILYLCATRRALELLFFSTGS